MDKVTMISAIIAAIAAFLNLWLTFFDRRDSIYVRYGPHKPIATQAQGLYVVNKGKHPVYLSDYGFITDKGELYSIPWHNQTDNSGHDSEAYGIGKTTIEPHDFFSEGISFKPVIIGVYAITSTQTLMRVSMIRNRLCPNILWKYLKIVIRPKYF